MPTLFTHHKIGDETYKKLNKNLKKEIENSRKYYDMFNQGWDNLFFYPYKWKKTKDFAIYAQTNQVDEFFKNLVLYIKNNHLENNSDLCTMVYGFINHYTADTIIHPFINSQEKKLGIKHGKLEFSIDTKIRENIKGRDFKLCIPKLKFNNNLLDLIDVTFLSTYNKKNIGKIFNKSHNVSYYAHRYLFFDRFGIKTFLFKIFDFITPFKSIKVHENTYYYKTFDKRILNPQKYEWIDVDTNLKYKYSFHELYENTINICIKVNELAYRVLHEDEDINKLIDLIKMIDIENILKLLKK